MSKFLRDLAERTVATYAQAFIGLLIAGWSDAVNVGTLSAAAIAAIPAALAVVKGLLAKQVGDPEDASFIDLPPSGVRDDGLVFDSGTPDMDH